MRFGIEATCWPRRFGYGRHLRSLVRALVSEAPRHEIVLVMDAPPAAGSVPPGVTVRVVPTSRPTLASACPRGHRLPRHLWSISCALVRHAEHADLRLARVGDQDVHWPHNNPAAIRHQIAEPGLSERVWSAGCLDDTDRVTVMNHASVLVLSAILEGFGLPAVEAARGRPVAATRESPLPALLGDAALYVDPRRPAELAEALTRVLDDAALRERLAARGHLAAGCLTWPGAARQLLAILEDPQRARRAARGATAGPH